MGSFEFSKFVLDIDPERDTPEKIKSYVRVSGAQKQLSIRRFMCSNFVLINVDPEGQPRDGQVICQGEWCKKAAKHQMIHVQ